MLRRVKMKIGEYLLWNYVLHGQVLDIAWRWAMGDAADDH